MGANSTRIKNGSHRGEPANVDANLPQKNTTTPLAAPHMGEVLLSRGLNCSPKRQSQQGGEGGPESPSSRRHVPRGTVIPGGQVHCNTAESLKIYNHMTVFSPNLLCLLVMDEPRY